jgi:hypothetical protein
MGKYLIFEFFPILQESRVLPLFDNISRMILFAIYLDYSFKGNKSYFRYVVLKTLFQALYFMIKPLKSATATQWQINEVYLPNYNAKAPHIL